MLDFDLQSFLAGGAAAGGAVVGGAAGGGDHGQVDEADHQNNAGHPVGQLPVNLAQGGGAAAGLSGVGGAGSSGASGGGPGL